MHRADVDIFHYLEPAKNAWVQYPGISGKESLGEAVSFFDGTEKWFKENKFDLAIIGVPESRNGDIRFSEKAPHPIRKWLYGMRNVSSVEQIADLGDVRGNSLDDRYQAVMEVVDFLTQKNVAVFLIGGTQDLTLPAGKFIRNNGTPSNLAVVDAFLDVDITGFDFSSSAFIHKLADNSDEGIENISVLGTQLYYCSEGQEQYMKDHFFPVIRLKDLRQGNIDRVEVVLRETTMLSFDFTSLGQQQGLPERGVMPNGFSNDEACRIFWYAGASDVLKVAGLYNVPVEDEDDRKTAPVAAQLVWHYLEGRAARCNDFPVRSIEEYEYKVVYIDEYDVSLHFYRNPENERWWIKVPCVSGLKIVACHQSDYQSAINKELPEVWWRHFRRSSPDTKKNKC